MKHAAFSFGIRLLGALALCAVATVGSARSDWIDVDRISQVQAQLFDESNGLPDLTVTAVSTAIDGYVWIGTKRGLVRFDGHRMVPIAGPGSTLSGAIKDVIALPDGTVWVSVVRGGLYRWDGRRWRRFDSNAGLPKNYAVRLRAFESRHGTRLFATGSGFVAEWDGRLWRPRPLPSLLAGVDVFDVLLVESAKTETLWVASFGRGLLRCESVGACAFVEIPVPGPGPGFHEISTLAASTDPDGTATLWVGSYGGGLAKLREGHWTRFNASNTALSGDYVLRLETVKASASGPPDLWVGLRSGIGRLRQGTWEMIDPLGRWDDSRIKALARGQDAQGTPQLWVGSDAGVARLRLGGPWRTISRVGHKGNGVWALLYEHPLNSGVDRLWLGSDGEGLWRYQNGQWKQFGLADGLPTMSVRSIARVHDGSVEGTLWAGTWEGHLVRLDGERFHSIPTPWRKWEQQAVAVILPTDDGEVWVGLRAGGAARWSKGQWRLWDSTDPANPPRVLDLMMTGQGDERTLWATTFGRGLAAYRQGRWRYYGTDQGLPSNDYLGISLLPDAHGRPVLWLGSLQHGIVRVDIGDPERPRLIDRPALPQTPDPQVYGIERDGDGDLILCSNYGASRWRTRPDGGFQALDYHRGDGLPHDECNGGALLRDPYGRIWIGTIGGAAVYLPQTTSRWPASLRLENMRVDGKERTSDFLETRPQLDASAYSLEMQFALLTGERESLNRYRTQLEPLEPKPGNWSPSNTRSFTGLQPGRYRLKVEAIDYAGTRAKPLTLDFEILPPWWRTWPAIVGAVLLSLLGLVGLLSWRERASRQREHHLVEMVRQRTSELEHRGDELGRINEELIRLSYRDPLTDLANRRMLIKRLQDEWAIARLRGTSIAFLMFDLDQFKSYNDLYGHLAGDDCLCQVARRINAELRKSGDSAGRYGGEEFGVVLPGQSLEQAVAVAERIRAAVEQAALPHKGMPQGVVTISVGVASAQPRAGQDAKSLIAAADAALYCAKEAGRNRVEY